MSEEPPPATESQPPQPSAAGQPRQPLQSGERYGIVSLARHVKDDGRALLLYTREPEPGR